MVDVVFKKNYFEELPDDIKDIILKKVKEMKEWDIINSGNSKKTYNYLLKYGDAIFDIENNLNANIEVLETIPFSINNIDLIFDTFKDYYILSYYIADVRNKSEIWNKWKEKNEEYYRKILLDKRIKIPQYKYAINKFIIEYKYENAYRLYSIFYYYLTEYNKYITKYIIDNYGNKFNYFIENNIEITDNIVKGWGNFNKKYEKYYNKNVKCNKNNYDKIKIIGEYLYDIDKIMIDNIGNYGIYGKEIYEKIKGDIDESIEYNKKWVIEYYTEEIYYRKINITNLLD